MEERFRFFHGYRYCIRLLDRRDHCAQFSGSRRRRQRNEPSRAQSCSTGPFESILWVGLAVTAGICEETIFRGYLQRQFVAWTRSASVGVLLSAVLFGAGHIYQGAKATIVIGVYGLLFGILAEARQNLRPGIITHAWHDALTGLIIRFFAEIK